MAEGVKVLILDDDEDDIFLIEDAIDEIEDSQYEVLTTSSPEKASEMLLHSEVDILLCDHLMGHITGIEFIADQRKLGVDIPIILLTGMNDRSTDDAALAAGASDFISKINISPDSLDRSIRYAVANIRKHRVFQSVLDNVNAGVVLIDESLKPTVWNPEFELVSESAVRRTGADAVEHFARQVLTESRILHVGKKVYEKKVTYTSDKSMVLLLHDVTEHILALREREEAQNKAAHLAMNCSLTGLPNRNSFSERIKHEINQANAENRSFFLLNLDLDKFKEVNDVYGHKTGDALLTMVSRRLQSVCRSDEFVARLGGDEFIAIQRCGLEEPNNVPELAYRLARVMDDPIVIDGVQLQVGVSIGVSRFPEHGQTTEELLSNADTAMYRAKREEIGKIHAFDEEMDRKIRETRILGHELRQAIDDGTIDVHFQAQADSSTGRITGFEALARWNHVELGPIPPGRFIPLAEEGGLICKLGQLVLDKACQIAVNWPTPLKVAVNVSPMQIRDANLVEDVHNTILRTGLPANRLELEVTESVLIDDKVRALHVLRGLKNLGVAIALDDFGTGFSSLSTLIAFPFDKIKIDRSFVENYFSNNQAALVTRTIINLGIQLGCHTIAEGVESPQHIDFLCREGCHSMQGFLIGRPAPDNEITAFFDENYSAFSPDRKVAV